MSADQVLTIVETDPTSTGPVTALPATHGLGTPAPNPFRRVTSISFDIPAAGLATLRVYDVSGRLVRTVVDGRLEPGRHQTAWDGRDSGGRAVASGIYFVRMRAGDFAATRRVVRLK